MLKNQINFININKKELQQSIIEYYISFPYHNSFSSKPFINFFDNGEL